MAITPQSLSLTHLVREPEVAPPAGDKPPLMLLLHGVGSHEHDLFDLAPHLDPRFLVLSLRAPITLRPGAFAWYPVDFTPQGIVSDETQAEASRQKILAFIDEAVEAYGADPARVFLGGFSQGAIMSLFAALTAPERVAGVVPMSGRLLPDAWHNRAPDDALRGLPVFAVHGTYDNVLPVALGREIRDKLLTLPLDFAYREYPMAHEISQASLSDIADWLTARLG